MIRGRERLVWNQRDLENQLRAAMEAYNPAVLLLFSTLDGDISFEFIRRYPLTQQTARVGASRMEGFITRPHYSGRTSSDVLVERIRPRLLAATTGTNHGKAFTAIRFAEQLQLVNRPVEDYNREISTLLDAHPATAIFTSFPGIGPVTAVPLLARMRGGGHIETFHSRPRGRARTRAGEDHGPAQASDPHREPHFCS